MSHYADRFSAETYAKDEPVGAGVSSEVPDGTSTHSLWIPERIFDRMLFLAKAYELHVLPALDPYGKNELTPLQAETLIDELAFVGDIVKDDLLASYMRQLVELAERCARSPRDERLLIEGA
ncbi:MAG: hypothetical protein E6I99_08280 [Chloroflexi bacterium]|nr:MAG: hypothetical protein E6I99_08280 [Chloroflexota bacterium]TMD82170.1 MAG: hypothetical protein E6I74_09850 [Chloroflexota bacterium]